MDELYERIMNNYMEKVHYETKSYMKKYTMKKKTSVRQ